MRKSVGEGLMVDGSNFMIYRDLYDLQISVDFKERYVGYVTQGSVFGKRAFIGTQTGPTSTGRLWLGDCTNISVTPYTFDEEFTGDTAVQSKDNLKVTFSVHLLL